MNGTVVSVAAKEGQTLNANNQAPTILTIADLTVMTVEAEVSEADINKIKTNMPVYFSTLGGGKRRWKSHVRQILPTPTIANNVVLYTVLFDVDNADAALLSQMTAQVFFVSSSAENVLSIPVGALRYIEDKKDSAKERMANLSDEQRAEMKAPRANGEGRERPEGRGEGRERGESRGTAGGGEGGRRGSRAEKPATLDSSMPRLATVSREVSQGVFETVEVKIGVTSRIAAEVISGLNEGDRVVSGIIQQNTDGQEKPERSERSDSNRIPRGL
jgi:macrolide-specific efflux system membrane fusion protein